MRNEENTCDHAAGIMIVSLSACGGNTSKSEVATGDPLTKENVKNEIDK